MGFQMWSVISFFALLLFAGAVGMAAGRGPLGILIDTRGRYSLTHFQLVLWTIVILSTLIGILISKDFDSGAFNIPPTLLGLMGISAGSAVLSTAVKGVKDAAGSKAEVAREGREIILSNGTKEPIKPHFAQIWLEEEGPLADQVVSITKYQNFMFTLIILGYYVAAAWKISGFPDLPERVVWLIGISHAGYVGGKVPNKSVPKVS